MSRARKRLKPYLKAIEELGLEVKDIEMAGSGHFTITVLHHGKEKKIYASYSASDRRSFLNWRSDLRRYVRTGSFGCKHDG